MFDRKQAKKIARINLKKHYVIFVLACLLAAFLGSSYKSSLTAFEQTQIIGATSSSGIIPNFTGSQVLDKIYEGQVEAGSKLAENLEKQSAGEDVKIGALELGRSRGVFSSLVNKISSGQILIIVFNAINSVIKSKEVTTDIFIVLSSIIVALATILVKNTFKVTYRRIFLEGYLYDNVKMSRFVFLFRVKKNLKTASTIFLVSLYQFLWDITIVGGIIKRYSYFMVPYIVAENPDINPKEAIHLSKSMMYGHKWECFMIELSMIGWNILGAFTVGFSDILFANPYKECVMTNFYVYVRDLVIKNGASYIEELNDKYLFEKADVTLIEETYADVVDIMTDDIDVRELRNYGVRGFIENNLGIIYRYDKSEDDYNIAIEQEEKIDEYEKILDLKQYPVRLFPIPESQKDPRLEHVHYLRHYSIWSIIAMFFIFCFIGWSWEVMLHLIEDAKFVNRGVLHGPWLPIYGSGGIMIVVLLFKYRHKPGQEALLTIILCGVVEYFTHWFLEVTKGTKWWDYTGYFLNINGRICAEGLLVFMLGGIAIVYMLAPMLDNTLRKVNKKLLKVICCVLLIVFAIDNVYSAFVPNTGEGITDYDEVIAETNK